jgi:hypothetical protein
MGDLIRFRVPEIITVIGGLVDETRVTIGVYGEDVAPQEISNALGCTPTSAHRKGDAREHGVPPWPEGAWLYTVEGKAPQGPAEVLAQLLDRVSADPQVWCALRARFTVRITFGIFVSQWNRGFELPPAAIKRLNETGAEIGVDIYANSGDDG